MTDAAPYITGELIPCRAENGALLVYLQKRDMETEHYPGYLALFGGAIEPGETPEQAMRREIAEELDFTPGPCRLLGVYASPGYVRHVFITDVPGDFESRVTVREGEYGKFFSRDDIATESLISPETRAILEEVFLRVTQASR